MIDWFKKNVFIYLLNPTNNQQQKKKEPTMDRSQLTVIPNKSTATTSSTTNLQQQQQSQLNRPKTSSQASTTIITNTNTTTATTTTIDLSLTLCHLLQRILIPFTLATGKFLIIIIIIWILKTNFGRKIALFAINQKKNWSNKKNDRKLTT